MSHGFVEPALVLGDEAQIVMGLRRSARSWDTRR